MTVHETVQWASYLNPLKLPPAVLQSPRCLLPGDWIDLGVGHLSGFLWLDLCFTCYKGLAA